MRTQSENRKIVVRYLALFSAAALILCVGTLSTQFGIFSTESSISHYEESALRGGGRRLPDYNINTDQLMGAEAGFVAAIVLVFLLLALLCCCCCGRRRGCSICDILACVCLYEICCDDAFNYIEF
jgi:hypothetical protein